MPTGTRLMFFQLESTYSWHCVDLKKGQVIAKAATLTQQTEVECGMSNAAVLRESSDDDHRRSNDCKPKEREGNFRLISYGYLTKGLSSPC